MNFRVGVVGDIHGEAEILEHLLERVDPTLDHLVFAGDYVNRGKRSAQVLERLIRLSRERSCTFLAGNHDRAMLSAIRDDQFDAFLQLGGAATVRSYVENPSGDVASQFASSVPREHVEFLSLLSKFYEADGLYVVHDPKDLPPVQPGSPFLVCGHMPQAGLLPRIDRRVAYVDTGCGTLPHGRLTCLNWPALDWVQVP